MSSITNSRHGADDTVAAVRRSTSRSRACSTRWLPAPGVLRPHCEAFVRSLEALGPHEFASRWESARRSIRENGVTYNVYGDPQGVDRPWELDMVPLLISPAEWSRLETGLIQRTRLLNLILRRPLRPAAAARRRPAAAVARVREPGVSCGRATAFACRAAFTCTCTPSTWRARLTVNGGCSPTARRRRRAPGMRSRTGSCCCAACRKRSAIVRFTGWRRSFARSATR